MSDTYKVWTCSVVVPGDANLPDKADSLLRHAVLRTLKEAEVKTLFVNSHWEDGEVFHEEEEEVLDSLVEGMSNDNATDGVNPLENNPDEPADYGSVTHGY